MNDIKIINLHRDETNKSQWFWHIEYAAGCDAGMFGHRANGAYFTGKNGEGMFFQSDSNGDIKQLAGVCQFSSCDTASGMRRKLVKYFNED